MDLFNMTIKEFEKNLSKIDSRLLLVSKGNQPLRVVFHDMPAGDLDIYDFENDKFNLSNCHDSLALKIEDLKALISFYISNPNDNQMKNPFVEYTDHLAEILQEKNKAYGDSFTKSVDEDGLLVLKIRLGDKLNRVSSLIKKGELKENDESLEDTLLDLAGYSILGLKYLKEHEND